MHYSDGVEGTRRRLATAEKYLKNFLISTECGFGRRPPETVPELLRIHAEVADMPEVDASHIAAQQLFCVEGR